MDSSLYPVAVLIDELRWRTELAGTAVDRSI